MGNEIFFFFFFILSQPLDVLVTAYDKYPAIENRSNAGNFFFFRNDTKECKRVKYYGREYIRIVQFNVNFLFDKG